MAHSGRRARCFTGGTGSFPFNDQRIKVGEPLPQDAHVKPVAALPLIHSWPLFEREQRLDLGMTLDVAPRGADAGFARRIGAAGRWECDLRDDRLVWSPAVYDLFGLPIGMPPLRAEVLPLYQEGSRALMERLRAYAIRHRRGFTLDAELRPADGGRRWMRLVAAPVIEHGRVVRLIGLKRDVTGRYP